MWVDSVHYNQDVKLLAVALAALFLAACSSRNIQTKEAVREAVVEYLNAKSAQTGLDMSKMTVEVLNTSFEADRARVTVAFNLKTGEGGMQMQYALERRGNKWAVAGTTGARPLDTPAPHDLPANHPPTGTLPEGHPPVDSKGK